MGSEDHCCGDACCGFGVGDIACGGRTAGWPLPAVISTCKYRSVFHLNPSNMNSGRLFLGVSARRLGFCCKLGRS